MISKQDAERAWTAADEAAFKACEVVIDRSIANSSGYISADLGSISGVNPRVRSRITDVYQQGGWTVSWTAGDQRDPGPFVRLS